MNFASRIESFIQFLLVSPKYTTFTESARCDSLNRSHDSWRRDINRLENVQESLWEESRPFVNLKSGYLIADDSINKARGPKIECTAFHHSGKHKKRVRGICLVSLVWTDGKKVIPVDFRIYHKSFQEASKNQLLREMLTTAHDRGFEPDYVMFDSWYCANETLRLLRSFGWSYLVGIKSNRVLDVHSYIGKMQTFRLSKVMILNEGEGEVLPLRGLGSHRCFSQSSSDGKTRYWCTDHTEMKAVEWKELKRIAFFIETFHRTLKQFCTIERCQARKANTQRKYISLAIRAFLRLEIYAKAKNISPEEAVKRIIRKTIMKFREQNHFSLQVHA